MFQFGGEELQKAGERGEHNSPHWFGADLFSGIEYLYIIDPNTDQWEAAVPLPWKPFEYQGAHSLFLGPTD